MAFDLRTRNQQSELMDDPLIDEASHHHALAGLRRINRLSRTEAAIWKIIRTLAKTRTAERPLTILEVASGGGDLAVGLASKAQRENLFVRIEGCDISSTAIELATRQASSAKLNNVSFHHCNAIEQPFQKERYDVILCSLFLHHLTADDSVRLLSRMKAAASELVLVDDLLRTRVGYWMAWVGCRLLTRSHVVHVDGPMSVEGAFTVSEAQSLAQKAGLSNVKIRRRWPQRFVLTWSPDRGGLNANR